MPRRAPPAVRPTSIQGAEGNERLNAFSDGVIAIAITLLVLEIKVPEQIPPGGLVGLLPDLLPKLAGHIVSFVVLGIYWVGHHNMFMHIKRHDRTLLWLNITFLLCIASMPFVAGLITHHGDELLAIASYGGLLVITGLVLDAIWWYASHQRRLVGPSIDPALVAFVHRKVLSGPLLYLIAIGIAFFSITLAKVAFAVVAILQIVPSPLDHYHHKELDAQE
jgi:uncharacterized membrane protein